MNEENPADNVTNPHDKLFRETWSNLENAGSFLQHYLPGDVLRLMDLSTLEICKDSFVEKELSDYYSDMLYKVMLSGNPGYVYVLFEHKSYYDRYLHLQLLEYMVKLSGYIPDFRFDLYDLTRFSGGEIKGTVMARVVLLLFKHISDPDLQQKLPNRHFPQRKENL